MTAKFPVKVQKKSLLYQRNGSDKEYHLVLITSADHNEAVYVERYGKRGTWGQMNPMCGDKTHHTNQFAKKYSEKSKKGYEQTRDCGVVDVKDIWDLHNAIEGYWWKIKPQLVQMFGQAQVDLVTRGGKPTGRANATPLDEVTSEQWDELLEAEGPAEPVQTEAERYSKNPLYGAF